MDPDPEAQKTYGSYGSDPGSATLPVTVTVPDGRDTGPVPESVANSGEASRFNTDDEDTR